MMGIGKGGEWLTNRQEEEDEEDDDEDVNR